MGNCSVAVHRRRWRPQILQGSDPASRHRLELQAKTAALIVAAWERIHAAAVITTRGPHADDREGGIEDTLAELAAVSARPGPTLIQPARWAGPPPGHTPAALAS